jgi:hypothetical protein
LEKWKKGTGVWAKQPSSSSPRSRYKTEETGRPIGGGGEERRRPGARRRLGTGAKRRGARGQPIPLLTLVWGALEDRIDGRWGGCSRWWPGRHRWWRWRAREGVGIGRGGAGCHGEPVRVFYRRGTAVRGDILSFAEHQWPAMVVRENPGVDSDRRDSRSIGCRVS